MADESNPLKLTADASQGVAEFERFGKAAEGALGSVDTVAAKMNDTINKAAETTEAYSQAVEKGAAESAELGKAASAAVTELAESLAKYIDEGGKVDDSVSKEFERLGTQLSETTEEFNRLRETGGITSGDLSEEMARVAAAAEKMAAAAKKAAAPLADLGKEAGKSATQNSAAFLAAEKAVGQFANAADSGQRSAAVSAVHAAIAIEKLKKEIQALKDQGDPTDELEAGLESLEQRTEQATEVFGEFKNQQAEMAGKIRAATSEARNFEGGQRDLFETLKVQIPTLGKWVGGIAIAQATFKQFYEGTREVIDGLKQFDIDIDKITKTMFNMEQGAGNLQKALDWLNGYRVDEKADAQELINLNNILSKKYGEQAATIDEARKKLEEHSKAVFVAREGEREIAEAHKTSGEELKKKADGYAYLAAEQKKSGVVEKYIKDGIQSTINAYEERGEKAPAALQKEADALGIVSAKTKEVLDAAKAMAASYEGDITAINKKTQAILAGIEIAKKDGVVTKEAADAIIKSIDEQIAAYKRYGQEAPKELLAAQEAFVGLGNSAAKSGDQIKKSFDEASKAAQDAGNKIDAILKKINDAPSVDILGTRKGGEREKEIKEMEARLKALRSQPSSSADQVAEMAALEDSIYKANVALVEQVDTGLEMNDLLTELSKAREEAAKADAVLANQSAGTTTAMVAQAEATNVLGSSIAATAAATTSATSQQAAATTELSSTIETTGKANEVSFEGQAAASDTLYTSTAANTVSIQSLSGITVATGHINEEAFMAQAAAAGSLADAIQRGIRLQEEYTVTAEESAQRASDARRDEALAAQASLDAMLAPGITEPDFQFGTGDNEFAAGPAPLDNSSLIASVDEGNAVILDSASNTFEVLGGISQEFRAQIEAGAALVLSQGSNSATVVADNTAAGLSTSTASVEKAMVDMANTVTEGYEGIGQAAARLAQEAENSFVGPPAAAAEAVAQLGETVGDVGEQISDIGGVITDGFSDGSFVMHNLGTQAETTANNVEKIAPAVDSVSDSMGSLSEAGAEVRQTDPMRAMYGGAKATNSELAKTVQLLQAIHALSGSLSI